MDTKKTLFISLEFVIISVISFFLIHFYAQADTLPNISNAIGNSGLETVSGGSGIEKFNNLARNIIVPNIKNLFIGVSIIILLYYVFQFIIATESDTVETQKTNLFWAAIGFAIIGLSLRVVEIIDPGTGNNLQTIGSRSNTEQTVKMIIIFIQYFAGGISVLFMVIAAIRIITSQGIEDEINKQKQNFTWGAIGLIIIMLSRAIVEVIYDTSGEQAKAGQLGTQGTKEIIGLINYILQYLGIAAILSFVLAGIFYIISLGDDEKTGQAKKIIWTTIIGIVIIYSSYAIVAYVARPITNTIN